MLHGKHLAQVGGSVKVGDLVRWKPDIPLMWPPNYGIVVMIIDEYLVGVLWSGCEYIYKEPIKQLEVII